MISVFNAIHCDCSKNAVIERNEVQSRMFINYHQTIKMVVSSLGPYCLDLNSRIKSRRPTIVSFTNSPKTTFTQV